MKKSFLMIALLCGVIGAKAQEKTEKDFKFISGFNIEPQIKNKEFSLPILLHSSVVWKDKLKLTIFGGYTISKEVKSPIFIAELGYEFENDFEPYLKGEKIILKEESIDYYAVGLAYNIKINKKFIIIPFSEYGKENQESTWALGVNCSYDLF